jgi:hypothetical protein
MIELVKDNRNLKLRNSLFWDVDTTLLNANSSKMLIVERVFTRGNMEEFKQLLGFYSFKELSQTAIKIGYMDARTLNFISGYLNIPKKDFLCYKKKLSTRMHWNS